MNRHSMLVAALAALALFAVSCDRAGNPDEPRHPATTHSGTTTTTTPTTTTATTATTATTEPAEPAPIEVTSPRAFDVVVGSFLLAGTANVFEAHVSFTIDDGDGTVQRGFVTASCGSGCRGTFRKRIRLAPAVDPGNYTLFVFEPSAEDGRPLHVVQVPLTVHATRD